MDPHRGRHGLLLALVVLCAFTAYAGDLDTYFVKDDFNIVLFAPDGEFDAQSWWDQLIWPSARDWDDIWRPIPALTWAVEYLVFGADPTALHIGQVLLHCLCCALLYWCVNRLTSFRNPLAGFVAALLFAVYPVHPEAVLWLTQRTVLMGLAFSLAALILFDVWLHRRRMRHLVGAWICVVLGTLSREHALPLPAVFCVQALFMGPERPLRQRAKDIGWVIGVYACFIAAYFGCRHLIWGRFTGPYSGFPSNAAYAQANGVFERFWNETILAGVVPANWHWFKGPVLGDWSLTWHGLIAWTLAIVGGWAVLRTVLAIPKKRGAFGFIAVAVTFTLVSWLPVWEVFWVNKYLLNSRSWYHLIAFLVAWLAVGLVDPWTPAKTKGRGALRLVVPGLLAIGYAVILQVNLRSWEGGSGQIRDMQVALVEQSELHGDKTMLVVLDTPLEYFGCTTISTYLSTMMGPPFIRPRVPCDALIQTARWRWLDPLLRPERPIRRWQDDLGRPIRYYVATVDPVSVRPLFGVTEPAQGDFPPIPVFPRDGGVAAIGADGVGIVSRSPRTWRPPESRDVQLPASLNATAEAKKEGLHVTVCSPMAVAFDAASGLHRFVLHLSAPEREFSFELTVEQNARRVAGAPAGSQRFVVGLANLVFEGVTLWPPEQGAFDGYLPISWRVEAKDTDGRSVGLSASSRLLVIDGRRTAP